MRVEENRHHQKFASNPFTVRGHEYRRDRLQAHSQLGASLFAANTRPTSTAMPIRAAENYGGYISKPPPTLPLPTSGTTRGLLK